MLRRYLLLPTLLLLAVCCTAQSNTTQNPSGTNNNQVPPAAQRDHQAPPPRTSQPVTGKTGAHGAAVNDTTTGSAGVETPPSQTDNGVVQQPGHHTEVRQPPVNAKPRPGAPPNWEQVGQKPEQADINAAKAAEAEVGGAPGGATLGVGNAAPVYGKAGQAANASTVQKANSPGTPANAPSANTKRSKGAIQKKSPTQPAPQQ